MFSKKKMFVIIVFIMLMFVMTTFASAPKETARRATRTVIFTDIYDGHNIAEYEVEVGKSVEVPEDPYHPNYVFIGWYQFHNQNEKVENFEKIAENLHVIALYEVDSNNDSTTDIDDNQ